MKKPQNMCLTTEVTSQFLRSLDQSLLNVQMDDLIYEPMKGGGSASTLYRLRLHKHSYVLRLFPPHASPTTRMHQITLAKEAGNGDFGPKILFVDPQMNGMIMEFIPGRTVEESDFEGVSNLAALAKFLQTFHRSGASFPLAVSPFKRFRDFYLKMEKNNAISLPRFSEVKNLMEDLETILKLLPVDPVPSHLDLHPLNIMLWENRFFLVDWVNGGMSDPYFDLATFSIFHGLSEERAMLFLTHYFERDPTYLEWDRFIITQPIRLFVIAVALFSSDLDVSMTYEELTQDTSLPSLSDFGKKGAIWPYSLLGVTMFKAALTLIDQDRFRSSLRNLKKHVAL